MEVLWEILALTWLVKGSPAKALTFCLVVNPFQAKELRVLVYSYSQGVNITFLVALCFHILCVASRGQRFVHESFMA